MVSTSRWITNLHPVQVPQRVNCSCCDAFCYRVIMDGLGSYWCTRCWDECSGQPDSFIIDEEEWP